MKRDHRTVPSGRTLAAFSAIIRTKDSASTLSPVLRSLLGQELQPKRVIVVDSGSSDDTLKIARAEGCEILHYPEGVPFNFSRALNLGIGAVQEPYALCLSSHSALEFLDTTAVMLDLLATHSDASACYAVHQSVRRLPSAPATNPGGVVFRPIGINEYNGTNGLTNSAAMIRVGHWLEVPFDESVPICEDQVWARCQYGRNRITLRLESHHYCYANPRVNGWKLAIQRYVIGRLCYPPFITWRGVARYAWKVARFREQRRIHWWSVGLLLWFKLSKPPVESFSSNYWDDEARRRLRPQLRLQEAEPNKG